MTDGIPRAPDLPVEERADTYRTGRPRRQRAARPRPADSSSEEEEDLDDFAPADYSPPEPDAPAAPDVAVAAADAPAAAAGTPDDPPVPDPPGDMPAPARGPPRVVDPPFCLCPGNHTLVLLEGTAWQKRCYVCHVSGRSKDTQFMCSTCKIPLCRISDCSRRYHTMAMYWSTPPRGTVRGSASRCPRHQQ